jgi:hypothetical protein
MNRNPRKIEQYHAANLECARIIASDPDRYPGVTQEWAAMILSLPAKQTPPATGRAA